MSAGSRQTVGMNLLLVLDVYSRGLDSVQVCMDLMDVRVLSVERSWPERTSVLGERCHRFDWWKCLLYLHCGLDDYICLYICVFKPVGGFFILFKERSILAFVPCRSICISIIFKHSLPQSTLPFHHYTLLPLLTLIITPSLLVSINEHMLDVTMRHCICCNVLFIERKR